MSTLFFSVLINVDEEIINYLIIQHLQDVDFSTHPHIRVRSAYILAKKEYKALTKKEKNKIKNKLKKGKT